MRRLTTTTPPSRSSAHRARWLAGEVTSWYLAVKAGRDHDLRMRREWGCLATAGVKGHLGSPLPGRTPGWSGMQAVTLAGAAAAGLRPAV